jgi:hypothetical protein
MHWVLGSMVTVQWQSSKAYNEGARGVYATMAAFQDNPHEGKATSKRAQYTLATLQAKGKCKHNFALQWA